MINNNIKYPDAHALRKNYNITTLYGWQRWYLYTVYLNIILSISIYMNIDYLISIYENNNVTAGF